MRFFRDVATIAHKDLRAELRTKEALNASIAFALVILVLFSFAFDPDPDEVHQFSGGFLWIVFSFAGALTLNRSLARELVNDCLDTLLASPVPAAAIFLGKVVANFALLAAVEIVALPVFGILYSVDLRAHLVELPLVLALGTWALSVIGTMFSALTVNLRLREVMLPTLVYPLLIPALIASMILTTDLIGGEPLGAGNSLWLKVLGLYDLVFTSLAMFFIDTVLVG